jgi:hypothetical protein
MKPLKWSSFSIANRRDQTLDIQRRILGPDHLDTMLFENELLCSGNSVLVEAHPHWANNMCLLHCATAINDDLNDYLPYLTNQTFPDRI